MKQRRRYFSARGLAVMAGSLLALSSSASADIGVCQGGTATVCDVLIAFSDVTPIGNSTAVHIPPSVLGDSYSTNSNLYFTAACVGNGYGGGSYNILDADKISCTAFPCPTSNVRLCNTSISIPGGTPMGGIVHVTMPPPFVENAFTVQCVGSGDRPPVYQITDHAAVSCNHASMSP